MEKNEGGIHSLGSNNIQNNETIYCKQAKKVSPDVYPFIIELNIALKY